MSQMPKEPEVTTISGETSERHMVDLADYDALRRYAEGLEKDAARYRWLRRNPNFMGWEHDFMAYQVDAAIDAAKGADRE